MSLFSFIKKKKESSSRDDFLSTLEKQREEKDKRRDILVAGQKPEAEDFGYTLDNPILTYTVASSDDYLGRLRTNDGLQFTWKRIGSYCVELHGLQNVMVDGYQLYSNGNQDRIIYICPYGKNSDYPPKGLTLLEKESLQKKRPDAERPPTIIESKYFGVDESKKKALFSNMSSSTDAKLRLLFYNYKTGKVAEKEVIDSWFNTELKKDYTISVYYLKDTKTFDGKHDFLEIIENVIKRRPDFCDGETIFSFALLVRTDKWTMNDAIQVEEYLNSLL